MTILSKGKIQATLAGIAKPLLSAFFAHLPFVELSPPAPLLSTHLHLRSLTFHSERERATQDLVIAVKAGHLQLSFKR